jgi:hypothetical protein
MTTHTPAQMVGRVAAVPLNAIFIVATLVGSTILGVGVLSNLAADGLRRRGSTSNTPNYTVYTVDDE